MPMPRGPDYMGDRGSTSAETAPFLLVRDGAGLVLIAPFHKRKSGPTAAEAALIKTVSRHVRGLKIWIDPASGAATSATIGDGQLQRRLLDCASFNVQMA
jgi:hypothetical protein